MIRDRFGKEARKNMKMTVTIRPITVVIVMATFVLAKKLASNPSDITINNYGGTVGV